MAIKDVETKCYILALFIRNDGARFLLGSGAYEFKEGQQHFAANTMQNDVVEVQGNDGYLLAGQVRRPGVQSFDGYVGDSSTSKPVVEGLRRDFFQFFRKGYFYKVVYVFPDGTAIQRKRGFLVDAPVVQELYQIYPEYHVALNFEDINYYFYDENDAGEEIYGKSAIVGLSMASGGLVWDDDGAVTDPLVFGGVVTVKGVETINNLLNVAVPLASVKMYGDTYQQAYSGKNKANFIGETKQGLTSVNNGDGTITISGTAAASGGYEILASSQILTAGTYTMSISKALPFVINFSITSGASFRLEPGDTSVTTTLSQDYYTGNLFMVMTAGETYNETFGIQLVAGSDPDYDFEPFVGGTASPNPDYPQDVQVVTGEQTVTVAGDGGGSQSHTISLGSIELCKTGDYQDYIYKSDGNWYKHEAIKKVVLDGSESYDNILANPTSTDYCYVTSSDFNSYPNGAGYSYQVSNRFQNYGNWFIYSTSVSKEVFSFTLDGSLRLRFMIKKTRLSEMSTSAVKTWFGNNPTNIYYALATPTDTQITDETLIGQLNALGSANLYAGENNLLVTASGTNLPAELEVGYYTEIEDGYGFVWEEGRSPSNIIAVDSIDDVFPVLTITGETENPILTNVTTGTIFQYNGTITASQTLVVDMMNQTATLNGTSVIGNVTGDWVYFAPGNNRVSYTATNADAPDATIEWQEIVG